MKHSMTTGGFKSATLLVTLFLVTAPVVWAQSPPSWLDWNKSNDSTQPSGATQTKSASSQAATPQPLTPQSVGSAESGVDAASGQTVVLQNLLDRVSRLEQDVRDLRGQNEVQENQIQRLKKAQQAAFSSFDDRLSKLEQSGGMSTTPAASSAAAPAVPPAAPPGTTSTGTAPSVTVPSSTQASTAQKPPTPSVSSPASPGPATTQDAAASAKQQNLYNAAFALLKSGQYDQAIAGFQSAIDADPQGQWTPSALFWQGETYYVEQKRKQAETAYKKILTEFPNSDRVPDALLKTGYIAYDEGKNKQARAIFQQVISKYPQSQAANLAKQRLARMDAEKR